MDGETTGARHTTRGHLEKGVTPKDGATKREHEEVDDSARLRGAAITCGWASTGVADIVRESSRSGVGALDTSEAKLDEAKHSAGASAGTSWEVYKGGESVDST